MSFCFLQIAILVLICRVHFDFHHGVILNPSFFCVTTKGNVWQNDCLHHYFIVLENMQWWMASEAVNITSNILCCVPQDLYIECIAIFNLCLGKKNKYISATLVMCRGEKKSVGGCMCRMKVWASEKTDGRMNVLSCSSDANFSHDWQTRRIHGSVCLP